MKKILLMLLLISCGDFQTSLRESVKDENLEPVSKSVFLSTIDKTSFNIHDAFEIQYKLVQQTSLLVAGKLVECDIESSVTKKHFSEDQSIVIVYDVNHAIKSIDQVCKSALIKKKDVYKKKISFEEYKKFLISYFNNLFNEVESLKIFKSKNQERFIIQFKDSLAQNTSNETLSVSAHAKQMIIDFDKDIVPLNIVAVNTGSSAEYELNSSSPRTIFSTFNQSLITKEKKSLKNKPLAKNIDLKKVRYKEFDKNIKRSHFSEIF